MCDCWLWSTQDFFCLSFVSMTKLRQMNCSLDDMLYLRIKKVMTRKQKYYDTLLLHHSLVWWKMEAAKHQWKKTHRSVCSPSGSIWTLLMDGTWLKGRMGCTQTDWQLVLKCFPSALTLTTEWNLPLLVKMFLFIRIHSIVSLVDWEHCWHFLLFCFFIIWNWLPSLLALLSL